MWYAAPPFSLTSCDDRNKPESLLKGINYEAFHPYFLRRFSVSSLTGPNIVNSSFSDTPGVRHQVSQPYETIHKIRNSNFYTFKKSWKDKTFIIHKMPFLFIYFHFAEHVMELNVYLLSPSILQQLLHY